MRFGKNKYGKKMELPFNGVFEVGLTDSAVVKEYGRAGAVLPSHWAWMMLEWGHKSKGMSATLHFCLFGPAEMRDNNNGGFKIQFRSDGIVDVQLCNGTKLSVYMSTWAHTSHCHPKNGDVTAQWMLDIILDFFFFYLALRNVCELAKTNQRQQSPASLIIS